MSTTAEVKTVQVSPCGMMWNVHQGEEVIARCHSREAAEGWARSLNENREAAVDVAPQGRWTETRVPVFCYHCHPRQSSIGLKETRTGMTDQRPMRGTCDTCGIVTSVYHR